MPQQPEEGFLRLVFSFVCLVAMLQACSTGRSSHSDAEAIKVQPGSELSKKSQKAFADRNPTIVSHIGELKLTTRMATPAEIPEDQYKMWLYSPAGGAGFLALGLAAGPMLGGSLVVGGVLLMPLGTYIYFHEKGIWDSINEALNNAEITRAIDSAMKDRLNASYTAESMQNVNVEIIIQAFGIVDSSSNRQGCFVVSAIFKLSRGNTELKQDRLQITSSSRSEDAPPPQCASLERFAKNEARLVKDTLAEYAEVLAVMAIDRIPRESSK